MREIYLETDSASSIDDFHGYLSEIFDFPDYYGKNLDALYDCLTRMAEDTVIHIPGQFMDMLEGYGVRVLKVLSDASYYNKNLHLQYTAENNQNNV